MVMSNDSHRQPPSSGPSGEAAPGTAPYPAGRPYVCPPWIGRLLVSPLRRLFTDPRRWLGPHVRPGMTVLEPGCAMGFFSLPLARMVGPTGRVVCVDLQATMIDGLLQRAKQAGLDDRLVPICGTLDDPRLEPYVGRIDFAAAIHMVHEVPDGAAFLRRLHDLLRPAARLLVIEPRWHVPAAAFARTVERARKAGLVELDPPRAGRPRSALFERPAERAP